MPTNLDSPNDNYDLQTSHVLPALLTKFHEGKINDSKEVEVWGSGSPLREFLHVDDLPAVCFFLMQHYNDNQFLNVGWGEDLSIRKPAELIKDIVGYK